MKNINLNKNDTPLSAKVNAPCVALTASQDWSDCVEDVTDMLTHCVDYVNIVVNQEVTIQNARFRMEGEDLRRYIMNIDKSRRLLHEGLMAEVNLVNRLCGKMNVPIVAENVSEERRETYFEFAKQVVDAYYTTGPTGSVSAN